VNLLVERIREIEADATSQEDLKVAATRPAPPTQDPTLKAILGYLNQRGYQMASYDRFRSRIDPNLTDDKLDEIIAKNPTLFRHAVLKDGKRGLAKLIP